MRWAAAAVLGSFLLQAPVERRTPKPVTPEAPQGLGDEQVPTIRVESRLVTVAVNAVDAKGAPVAGLTRADFEVLEDGKPQPIAIFERESSTPLSIVMAIDTSGTVMTSERLERNAAKSFVRALLRDQDELDLMDFSDTVREIVPFTNQKKRIETGLGELQKGDETSLYDAIYLASQRLAETRNDAGRRRVLVLITDGGDSKHSSRYAQALGAGAACRSDDLFDHYCADCGGCGPEYGRRARADPDVGRHGREVLLRRRSEGPGARHLRTCRTICGRST